MSEIILYLTRRDADQFRRWVNAERSLAWIVKHSQSDCDYVWKAVHEIADIPPQEYSIWHTSSDALSIPSGSPSIRDTPIMDPFAGWRQRLPNPNATAPWFGANLPGPYFLRFAAPSVEASESIARSGLFWHGDRFRSIGKPASEPAKDGWKRIQRFVQRNSISIPWPYDYPHGKKRAYAFEDAYLKIGSGAMPVTNPSLR